MDNKNSLLKRREVKIIVEAKSNPGFSDAMKMVSEQFKAKEENIVVHNVKGKFGRKTFLIDAFVYDSKEDKERIEPKPKAKKAEPQTPITSAAPQAPTTSTAQVVGGAK